MMSEMLIDYEMYEKVLPLATLMNYVATDLVKTTPYMIKARILKGIACCNLGYISQSIKCFYQIIENKDKIIPVVNQSEYIKQKEGSSFKFDGAKYQYRNDLPPESPENMATINELINSNFDLTEKYKVSPLLNSQLNYLKHLIILSLCKDPFDLTGLEDMRTKYFNLALEGFQKVVSTISEEEEIIKLRVKIRTAATSPHQDARTGKYIEFLRRKLRKKLGVEAEENKAPDYIPRTKFDNTDEEQPHSIRRANRLSWIIRSKLQISHLQRSKGSLLDSFYIARENLFEIAQLNMPIGVSNKIEKPFEDEKFKLPEDLSGGAPGKKAPPAKEEKKAEPVKKDKGKAGKAEIEEDFDEEDRQFEMEDERIWTEMNLDKGDKSELPCAYLWALSKYTFIDILFKQARYEEAVAQIQAAKLECESLNDTYFMRLYYEILTMVRIHNGEIDEGIQMFEGLKSYADRLGHDDVKLAQFYGNMGEFMMNAKPERAIDLFKESRILFWVSMQLRGLKIVDVNEHIDVKDGNVKQQKIPDSDKEKKEEYKPPVEEKKDQKAKGKADPKGEPPVERDYSNIEKVINFKKEMNHEMFIIDENEATKINKNPNIYLLHLDNLIKINLRYAQALCTLDNKYDLSIIVLSDTLKIAERCLYLNPYHKYLAHFLYGHCSKMLFLDKIKEFQKRYGVSTAARGHSKYHNFIEGVPNNGLALAHLFHLLPNYSNNIRNSWKELLTTAKDHLEKSVKVAKNECVFSEFGVDLSDSAYSLSEVCFLLAEYRESTQKYRYIDHREVYLKRSNLNPQDPADGEEPSPSSFEKWEQEQLDKDYLEILNLRQQAREYFSLGNALFKARHELAENYYIIIQTNLTDPSKIPKEFLNDIFQTQAIQSSAFLEKLSETMEPDLWNALKAKVKGKVEAGEVISMLKTLIDELRYFTFGFERKSKGICLIHRYLRLNLASYVQRCVVDFPEVQPINELTEAREKELDETKEKPWMQFTDKHSKFFYILQESKNLVASDHLEANA